MSKVKGPRGFRLTFVAILALYATPPRESAVKLCLVLCRLKQTSNVKIARGSSAIEIEDRRDRRGTLGYACWLTPCMAQPLLMHLVHQSPEVPAAQAEEATVCLPLCLAPVMQPCVPKPACCMSLPGIVKDSTCRRRIASSHACGGRVTPHQNGRALPNEIRARRCIR